MKLPAEIFRTYDIRGVVATGLTPAVTREIGRALGSLGIERNAPTFAVCRDGRLTGPELVSALIEGLTSSGANAIDSYACKPGADESGPEIVYRVALPTNGFLSAAVYSDKLAGRKTASGQVFSQSKLTAAHPSLAYGTKVKVTNTKNNKTVDVVINDRGPTQAGRVIDLSSAAAATIGIGKQGMAPVKLDIISEAPAKKASK